MEKVILQGKKKIEASAYLLSNRDCFFFHLKEKDIDEIKEWKELFRIEIVHFFLCNTKQDTLAGLAKGIQFFHKQGLSKYNICVYYPKEEIVKYLGLQGVSKEWYNLYINLWDELFMDFDEKSPEYIYSANEEEYLLRLVLKEDYEITFYG